MATKNKTITIKTDEENPEPAELIAKSIIEISAAYKKLQTSRLKMRAIVVLIKDMRPRLKMDDIEMVLKTVPLLEEFFIEKPKK